MIATLLDHHGIAIPVVTLPDHFSIAIPITVAADRSDRRSVKIELSEHRSDLGPKRGPLAIAIRLRWRRLCGADRIGCRKTVDQTGFQFRVGVAIRRCGFARIGGMPVVRRGMGFLSNVLSGSQAKA